MAKTEKLASLDVIFSDDFRIGKPDVELTSPLRRRAEGRRWFIGIRSYEGVLVGLAIITDSA